MGNKAYTYEISWCWREDGNRKVEDTLTVKSTTVQRAISKAIKELNKKPDGGYLTKEDEDYVKATDVFILDATNVTKGFME